MSYLSKHLASATTKSAANTPQTAPIPGRESDMVLNDAGGYVFPVTDMTRLNRFLVLGSAKGSYYASEKELTIQNATVISDMIVKDKKGADVVRKVLEIDGANRAPKQDPSILALAMCARLGDEETKKLAYDAVGKVCRIPTTLFQWVELYTKIVDIEADEDRSMKVDAAADGEKKKKKTKVSKPGKGRGFGRAMRRTIATWYLSRPAKDLAYTVTKYKNRNGWTHSDLLRVAHVQPKTLAHNLVLLYATHGLDEMNRAFNARLAGIPASVVKGVEAMDLEDWTDLGEGAKVKKEEEDVPAAAEPMDVAAAVVAGEVAGEVDGKTKTKRRPKSYETTLTSDTVADQATFDFLNVTEKLMKTTDETEAAALIRSHRLAREHVPSTLLNSLPVWKALLADMPMTAMIRNLGKMTSMELLKPLSDETFKVTESLTDRALLKKARIHPFNVLVALQQYRAGRGLKGSLSWTPVPEILGALEKAFYSSFEFVEPTKKRFLLGLDVSGSMCCPVMGSNIMCNVAAAAMAMTFVRTEPRTHTMAFCDKFLKLNLNPTDSLEDVVRKTGSLPFGGTDCALPMLYALEHKLEVDVFMVFTDCETYFGKVHPTEALKRYRKQTGIPAKLVVLGMSSNGFTIADPEDAGMLDVCGFDSAAPSIIILILLSEQKPEADVEAWVDDSDAVAANTWMLLNQRQAQALSQ
ncbi:60 kDa SS-A/Ro ribonucleoprotein [Phlyctochytrium planicorne]|nr:60 kDa SS-A/Ro ribonucleoprotein [Phlyctochytrium planicorne]